MVIETEGTFQSIPSVVSLNQKEWMRPHKSGGVASGVTQGNHIITREWQIKLNISSTQ